MYAGLRALLTEAQDAHVAAALRGPDQEELAFASPAPCEDMDAEVWLTRSAVRDGREVQKRELPLAEALEASPDTVVMSNLEGRITFVNDSACRMLGLSREQLLCMYLDALCAPRSRSKTQRIARHLVRHERHEVNSETGLRTALRQHELVIHYQPQFEIISGRACGVEALARWYQPSGETISPCVFIPLAERTGLITALGEWVLQEACSTVSRWHALDESPPILCVNVSTHQICKSFPAVIARVLELTGFPAERLELEITESVLIGNTELALECLGALKSLGVRLAMDDFGTGYSSLTYLSRLPVDRLKLDQSLIHRMTSEPKDAAIVRAVISLGEELGFEVIAEGVETEEQLYMLAELGCQQAQGHLLTPPLCATAARGLLDKSWGARPTAPLFAARSATGIQHAS